MSARWLGITVALAFGALPLAGEGAHVRGNHESSSSSSSSGESAHVRDSGSSSSSGSSHSSDSRHSSPSASSWDSSSSHSSRSTSTAERRHPRAGSGTGRHHRGHRGHRGGYDYSYRYYSPYYYGSYWGYSPYYYGWYGWGYPSYRHRYSDSGSLRILVDPSRTRVYVDGYYAGVVDDFDGLFQRLNLPPGRHEISLKLDGYRTHRVRLYVPIDRTIKIHHDMVKGSGEDSLDESLDEPARGWAERERDRYDRDERASVRRDDDDDDDAKDADDDADEDGRMARAPEEGELRLKVTPSDASVYIDGQFRGEGSDADEIELRPGRHRVEIVRPGYRTFDAEVEVTGDKPAELNVALERP